MKKINAGENTMSEDVNARSYDLLNRDMRAILFRILGCLGGCKAKSDYFRAIFSSKDMIFAMLKKKNRNGN